MFDSDINGLLGEALVVDLSSADKQEGDRPKKNVQQSSDGQQEPVETHRTRFKYHLSFMESFRFKLFYNHIRIYIKHPSSHFRYQRGKLGSERLRQNTASPSAWSSPASPL